MTRPDTVVIRTPEGVEFALRLAGPFSRMIAYSIDLAVIGAFGFALQRALAPFGMVWKDISDALAVVLYFAISLSYCVLAEWMWRGQTIGKKLVGLRVVDANGLRLMPAQVIVRNLLRFLDALPALYLIGAVACVWSRRRQRLGDLAAATVVIRVPKLTQPDLTQALGSKYNSLAEHRHLAARLRQKVRPEVAELGLDALLRRAELEAAARLILFRELADYFRGLVAFPGDVVEELSDEQYVRNVVEILFTRATDRLSSASRATARLTP